MKAKVSMDITKKSKLLSKEILTEWQIEGYLQVRGW